MHSDVTNRAKRLFTDTFQSESEYCGSAPGRVELLGNHTDYNGGFVLTAAVNIRTCVMLRKSTGVTTRIVTELPGYGVAHIDLSTGPMGLTDDNRWAGYIAGVLDHFSPDGIMWDVSVASDVPDGSGISSSAAVLVATASAVIVALGLNFSPMEIAVACRSVENGPWVGAPVGLLDQFSSACGLRGMALFLDCKSFDWKRVPLDPDELGILIVNTNVKHALADGGGYSSRRKECETAARLLSANRTLLLRDVTGDEYDTALELLPELIHRRVKHVWSENGRVESGTNCLEKKDYSGFGQTLNASHESCHYLFENTCIEIDLVQQILRVTPGVYGAKLSGGGWGGSVVAVINPIFEEQIINTLQSEYGEGLSILSTFAADGVHGEAL